jgi:hypothetical protein
MRRHVERARRLRQTGADRDGGSAAPPVVVGRQGAARLTLADVVGRTGS